MAPIGGDCFTGLAHSIPALARAQREAGAIVEMVTTDRRGPFAEDVPQVPVRWWFDVRFDRQALLARLARKTFSVVVFHSTYIPVHARLAKACRDSGVPYVLTPRAGLTAGARARRRWKKAVANRLWFDRLVRGAAAIHFLTETERRTSATGDRPAFVVGNGIDLPESWEKTLSADPKGPLRLTYIGRLSIRAKGLDRLLDGCATLAGRDARVAKRLRVGIHGPGTRTETRWLTRTIHKRGLASWVFLEAPVFGSAKAALLRETDLFLHTSRFEGMPMAVLEALAHGVPCLLSGGTGLADEVQAGGAGIAAPEAAEELATVLGALDPRGLADMRPGARAFASDHSWEIIGRRTVEKVSEILKRYPRN